MSIRVRVVLLASLREIVGKREIVEEVDSKSTVRHVLERLAQRYGRDFRQIMDTRKSSISLEFLVSINGQVIRDANAKLNNNDVLMLSIPVGGG
jgi:MoaD family protein